MADMDPASVTLPAPGEAEIERWLREEVAPVYDEMVANPHTALPIDDVFTQLRRHHANRMKSPRAD